MWHTLIKFLVSFCTEINIKMSAINSEIWHINGSYNDILKLFIVSDIQDKKIRQLWVGLALWGFCTNLTVYTLYFYYGKNVLYQCYFSLLPITFHDSRSTEKTPQVFIPMRAKGSIKIRNNKRLYLLVALTFNYFFLQHQGMVE